MDLLLELFVTVSMIRYNIFLSFFVHYALQKATQHNNSNFTNITISVCGVRASVVRSTHLRKICFAVCVCLNHQLQKEIDQIHVRTAYMFDSQTARSTRSRAHHTKVKEVIKSISIVAVSNCFFSYF